MKMKKRLLAIVLAVCIVVAGFFIWKEFFSTPEAPDTGNEQQEAEAIETEGEIEIVIPDDQEDGGGF